MLIYMLTAYHNNNVKGSLVAHCKMNEDVIKINQYYIC